MQVYAYVYAWLCTCLCACIFPYLCVAYQGMTLTSQQVNKRANIRPQVHALIRVSNHMIEHGALGHHRMGTRGSASLVLVPALMLYYGRSQG